MNDDKHLEADLESVKQLAASDFYMREGGTFGREERQADLSALARVVLALAKPNSNAITTADLWPLKCPKCGTVRELILTSDPAQYRIDCRCNPVRETKAHTTAAAAREEWQQIITGPFASTPSYLSSVLDYIGRPASSSPIHIRVLSSAGVDVIRDNLSVKGKRLDIAPPVPPSTP